MWTSIATPFRRYWHEAEDSVPSAAVAPDGVEQVQAVVKIANKYKIPLWTISTGKNLGYGGSAPRLSGSVVLDLKRMNRILEVNDQNHFALVEPGVSYFDLYSYIQEHKLKVWIDPPDPGWGSPVGNSLERGGGRGPLHDHFATVCGMEVVLPNGELMRTGMGAMPGSKTWQQYRYGFGPYVDGMFSQSNFGIVTKMGVWLLPEPEAYRDGTVMVAQATTTSSRSSRHSPTSTIPKSCREPWLSIARCSPIACRKAEESSTFPATSPSSELERIGREQNMPYWSAELHFYGPAKVVDLQWEYTKDKFSAIPGATFKEGRSYRFPWS